jgi:hypothetical protein
MGAPTKKEPLLALETIKEADAETSPSGAMLAELLIGRLALG